MGLPRQRSTASARVSCVRLERLPLSISLPRPNAKTVLLVPSLTHAARQAVTYDRQTQALTTRRGCNASVMPDFDANTGMYVMVIAKRVRQTHSNLNLATQVSARNARPIHSHFQRQPVPVTVCAILASSMKRTSVRCVPPGRTATR